MDALAKEVVLVAVMALVNGAVQLHAKVVARVHVRALVGALVIKVARMDVMEIVGELVLADAQGHLSRIKEMKPEMNLKGFVCEIK